MAYALKIVVKESLPLLKKMLKNSPVHHSPKIKMLLVIKESEFAMSKNELAEQTGTSHHSIQTWRKKYQTGGIKLLLKDGRIGFRPSVVTDEAHEQLRIKLHNPIGAFTSFKDIQHWIDTNFIKGIKYNSLRHYIKRHFGAKLKVARKSHVKKDKEAAHIFKKTSVKSVKKK